MDITKIIIKTESGFTGPWQAYKDKLTLDAKGISYEMKPMFEESEYQPCKWSYRSNSTAFQEIWQDIVAHTGDVVSPCDDYVLACDAGTVEIISVFEDKNTQGMIYSINTPEDYLKKFLPLFPTLEQLPPVWAWMHEEEEAL